MTTSFTNSLHRLVEQDGNCVSVSKTMIVLVGILFHIGCRPSSIPRRAIDDGGSATESFSVQFAKCVCHTQRDWSSTQYDSLILGFQAETSSPEESHLGSTWITAWSDKPLGGSNVQVRAWIGEQELSAVSMDQLSLAFDGYLARAPAETDFLKVEIYGSDPIETGLSLRNQLECSQKERQHGHSTPDLHIERLICRVVFRGS